MNKFEKQARLFGTEFVYEEVTSIVEDDAKENSRKFIVKSSSDKAYPTLALILAFGKTPRDLNAPGEREFKGKGVSYCAVCDGPLFKQKKVAIVGM
jgi:thioredoxin reductase (NADPH)